MNVLPIASVVSAFLLIGIWCTRGRVPAIEADLEARVGRALSTAPVSFHALEARGRRVSLSGIHPDEVESARAHADAVWGVAAVEVRSDVSDGGPWLRIEADGDTVSVSGFVGTGELETRIRRELVRSFPGRTLALDLSVGDGGEAPVSWPSTFEPLFTVAGRRIGNLDLTLDARVLTVEGTVIGEAAVDSLGAQFIGTAPGVRLHNALAPGESAESRLAAALSGPPLSFEEGSARLDARARTLLAGVAQAMALSPAARISVRAWGDPAAGVASSRRVGRARAEAIVRFLGQRGVDRGRMTFEGLAPEATSDGSPPTVQIALSEG